MLGTILIIILILLLIGALPTWGYSGGWGYYPAGRSVSFSSSIPQYFGRLIGGLLFRGTRAKKNHDEGVGVRRHRLGAWT